MEFTKTATFGFVDLYILPRVTLTWDEFKNNFPGPAIALDGVVNGGPRLDQNILLLNADHHDGVERSATMSTCKQIEFAIKGGLGNLFFNNGNRVSMVINDIDQDTTLALWLVLNYKCFEGQNSIPNMSRLINITDKLDVTGGAYPINLNEKAMRQHNWIFRPYTDMRVSGRLSMANEFTMLDALEAMFFRLDLFRMGQAEELSLDTRNEIYFSNDKFMIYNEIGTEARYWLYSQGMKAFVAKIATRSDGRHVYSIGRIQYTNFPMDKIYVALNEAEAIANKPWGGSNLIGGSRNLGSSLSWEQIRDILLKLLT